MEQQENNSITLRGARWLLLFVFYLQFLIPSLLESKWQNISQKPLPENLMTVAIQLFAVALPCAVFLYLYSANPVETLKLKRMKRPKVILCVLIGITAQSVASVLNIPMLMYIKSRTGALPGAAVKTPQNITEFMIGLLVVALLPAIFEELLMRGIVLTSTQNNGYRASLLIGGIYFTLIHNQVENIAGHFFLGFLLCYIVWMTESVFSGMIAHFSFNAFGMLLDYLTTTKAKVYTWLGSGVFQWSITIVSIFLFFLFAEAINRKRIKRNKSHKLGRQLVFSVLNFPVILIILGYILFQYVRYL